MAGLYIHIPFCKSRCIYCGFYSTTQIDMRQEYVDAVCREMEMRCHKDTDIHTIYFGGGTPSQLTSLQLKKLLDASYIYNKVSEDAEITIEVNPDDVSAMFAEQLPQLGVNRVSMGIQTFNDERLHFLKRRHTATQAVEAVRRLRQAGIQNISIDLMYGFPGETLEEWQQDIDAVLVLGVEHISAYCLMMEEGTPLHRMGIEPTDEETERQMYEVLIDKLTAAGYEHYEISNFARPGYRSRHNSSYWQDLPYIGLGAAAHSYSVPNSTVLGGSAAKSAPVRSWNVSDINTYIAAIERGELPSEQETLDADTHYNDRITTALRTSDGLDLTTLSERHRRYCLQEAQRFLDDGLLRLDSHRLILTRKGLFVSDMVMSSLMLV